MADPLVTVAIPFYNSEKYLPYAIQSVINQTYQNWELLLIDDGGNDYSLKIACDFASRDERIRVISDGQNKKLTVRLNESIQMAKGVFYARMDDDDIMTVDRLERQIYYLKKHPDVDVIGSSAMHINYLNEIVGSHDMEGVTTGFIHPTVMARTQWFRNNLYSEELPRLQDMDLWLRTYRQFHFHNIPEPLLFYRNMGTPIVSRYHKSMQSLRLIANRYQIYNKSWLWSVRLKAKSYLQQNLYFLFALFHKTDLLVRFRNTKSVNESMILGNEDVKKSIAIEDNNKDNL